jgi:mono/diheme cytochrome c family protein
MIRGEQNCGRNGAILAALALLFCVAPFQARVLAGESMNAAPPEDGREIFNTVCGHCHGPDAVQARAKIDLRLLRRKYGNAMEETYFRTVLDGRPSKGMPAWKDVFTAEQVVAIFDYLKGVQSD